MADSQIASSARGILDLPSELHEHVWSYLDWDRAQSLLPERPGIFAISRTCKALREAVLPILFRHVILRLQWAQGSLFEPALFRLRRDRPDLAKHIRTVQIRSQYGELDLPPGSWYSIMHDPPAHVRECWDKYTKRCRRVAESSPPFVANVDLDHWLDPAGAGVENLLPHHVSRVRALVYSTFQQLDTDHQGMTWLSERQAGQRERHFRHQHSVYESCLEHSLEDAEKHRLATGRGGFGYSCPDEYQRQDNVPLPQWETRTDDEHDRAQLSLETLALVVSCVPGSTNTIVLNACPTPNQDTHNEQHNFALATAATAMRVLGPGLTNVSVATTETEHRRRFSRAAAPRKDTGDAAHFTSEVLACLSGLRTIRLTGGYNTQAKMISEGKFKCWTGPFAESAMNSSLRSLEIWDASLLDHELCAWLEVAQTGLKQLVLHDVYFRPINGRQNLHPQNTQDDDAIHSSLNRYIAFALDLRTALPHTQLVFENIKSATWNIVPTGGRRFVEAEVANTIGVFTEERKQRLLQDFASFMPSWRAEEEREQGPFDDSKQFGKLIDAAMASRSARQWS